MDKMEKAELVRSKTGVGYADAVEALEACEYDVLDAIVWLERRGKTTYQAASYTTQGRTDDAIADEMSRAQSDYEQSTRRPDFGRALDRLFDALKGLLRKGVETSFVAERKGRRVFSVPTLLLIVLLILAFWVTIPLLVVGMFLDFRYHFEGIGSVTVDINDLADKASDGVESIKRDVMNGAEQGRKDGSAR